MSQRDDIRHALERGPVCSTTFLSWRIPRAAARIAELRAEGLDIVTEPCDRPFHVHDSRQVQYRLQVADQRALF